MILGGENVSSRMTPSESLLLLEAIKEKGYNKMPICPLKSWKCQHSGAISSSNAQSCKIGKIVQYSVA